MAILSTEAVVLSSIPQGETSKIVRLFARDCGRLTVIAKGSRKWKNRFGGILETLNYLSIVYYHKESRDLQMLSQADTIDTFQSVKSDLDRLAAGMSVVELVQQLVVEEESNERLFELVTGTLAYLNDPGVKPRYAYWRYLMQFLTVSGFGMDVERCRACGLEVDMPPAFFSNQHGGVICGNCRDSGGVRELSGEALQVLRQVRRKTPETLSNLTVSGPARLEIDAIFESFYRCHFDGYRTPQSMQLSG